MNITKNRKEVFIVGSARSGTTLMSSVLFKSGLFAEYHAESLLMSICMPKYGNLLNTTNRQRFIDDWADSRQGVRSGISKEAFSQIVKDAGNNYYRVHRGLMEKICTQTGKSYWVEGTPANVFLLDSVFDEFPGSRIIHMVRDGRDVALSLLKLGWVSIPLGQGSRILKLWWAAHQWRDAVEAAQTRTARANADRMITVLYEELVGDPAKTIGRVCEFLDIPLDTIYDGNELELKSSNSAYGEQSTTLSTRSLGRWKNDLSGRELAWVESACGDTLLKMGYQLEADQPAPLPLKLANLLPPAYLRFKRFLRYRTILGRFINDSLEMGKT